MLTKALSTYILCTRCKIDPSDAFEPKGGIKVFLDMENLEKTGENYVIPVVVVLVGPEAKFGLKPGDVVYTNPKFMFQTVIEGGIYFWVNEGFTFGMLPAEDARTAGAVADVCKQPQFRQTLARPMSRAALEAAAKAGGIQLP
jgi:hypothetical protein